MTVYRVQAADGRGPWRPGWSHVWIDGDAPEGRLSETVMDLMPIDQLQALSREFHYGCACRTLPALLEWFTPIERERLQSYGYYPVKLQADIAVAESSWQVLIGRRRPFVDGATRIRWVKPEIHADLVHRDEHAAFGHLWRLP